MILKKPALTPDKRGWLLLALLLLAFLSVDAGAADYLNVAGSVKNPQGKGVKDVVVQVTVNSRPLLPRGKEGHVRTGAWGSFAAEFTLPAGALAGAEVRIQASKPAWRPSGPIQLKLLPGGVDGAGNHLFYAQQNLPLERQVTPAFWLATLILLFFFPMKYLVGAENMFQWPSTKTWPLTFAYVYWINIALAAFNLLPAFPMDGGRVLRALLAMRLDYVRATQVAAFIGQGMAFVLGFIGLFGNPFLLFIALFVWIGASQEAGAVQVKNSMGGIPVTRAMMTDFRTLSPRDNLSQVVAYILAGSQHDFPVVDANGRVAGIPERDAFMKALTEHGQSAPVMDFVRNKLPEVDSHEMLESALSRLQESGTKSLPVTHGGLIFGCLNFI